MLEQAISNKVGWTRVAFGDVVRKVSDKVDPWESGLERYVAGDHMDTDDLRIRRWGIIGDDYLGPAFHMRFKPGHVLYGSRRTYLRKVALADFEGITANTTYVLESKDPNVLMPELLPFIMQTEAFHTHSIGRSKGSVNPYINFPDIADFGFSLPPVKEQARLVSAFLACEKMLERLFDAEASSRALSSSFMIKKVLGQSDAKGLEEITRSALPLGWRLLDAEKLCEAPITKGATPPKETTEQDTGIPFLKVYNLTSHGALDFSIRPTFLTSQGNCALKRSEILPGDVLMNIVGPPLGKVSRVPDDFPASNINQAIARFRPNDKRIGDWLVAFLLSAPAQRWFLKRSKKTSGQRNLTLALCNELPVPLPSVEDIDVILSALRAFSSATASIQHRTKEAIAVKSHLLVDAFGSKDV